MRRWRSGGRGLLLGGVLTTFAMLLYHMMSVPLLEVYHPRMLVLASCDRDPILTKGKTISTKGAPRQVSGCSPKMNVMFMKTHKTASSTILNILFRFGEKHGLRFAFPNSRNDFVYPEMFNRLQVKGYQPGMCFNMVCNHMRFNESEVVSVLPPDATFITILRDPADVFESAFHYFNSLVPLTWVIPAKEKLAEFLKDPWRYYSPNGYNSFYLKNLLLFDLGYDNNLEPDDPRVEQAIQAVDKRFQLVMVAEYFDESLILLKDTLCWELEDLLFLRLNMRRDSSISKMTEHQRMQARDWNAADWRLYRYFNATFWAKVEVYGRERMAREVAELRRRNAEMATTCVEGGRAVEADSIRDATLQPWQPLGDRSIMGYNLRKDIDDVRHAECRRMLTPELQYMYELGVNLWAKLFWRQMLGVINL
ncbi:galactosylceramide sulfotransferase-like [Paramormyrops kingsleyae]|uniref:Galactose-3-O-sulfotransferase 1 n=1 Tax=Paramormyrops kingsleyae TaxID=1676925 RepID=A0A3B3QPS2_9TELE|nr:galactosylceramide sulfotransferase-like [Paramormyrops kingsleyae]XP_023678739.1 galactosylceramide sulfotransferase-like [Paramormyrops kingsleyae]XP_023678740.1 galactosylceramide sulfotransferase-like [Paramormyrops kingsleyae]